jgi:hypothetical protein
VNISFSCHFIDACLRRFDDVFLPLSLETANRPAPVAMLERNLMRLFYNFHHPDRQFEDRSKVAAALELQPTPWYGNVVQFYTALAATAILGMMLTRSK